MAEGVRQEFLKAVRKLNVNRTGGRPSPHKPVLLLAVLDLCLAGKLSMNRVQLTPALLMRYKEFFEAVAEGQDTPNPHLPYFYMRSEPFWELCPASGTEGAIGNIGSISEARQRIAFAFLDEAVWEELKDPEFAEQVAQEIMGHWFPANWERIQRVWNRSKEISQYEIALETGSSKVAEAAGLYVPARDAAFRRLVVEGYDYRCAASGWRFTLDGWSLVEAAHIVPFKESHDDRPENGIALTPSFHRLMDKRVIAPGPDMKWYVSKVVDRRIPDNQKLIELDGASLILPNNAKYQPDPEALEHRLHQLMEP